MFSETSVSINLQGCRSQYSWSDFVRLVIKGGRPKSITIYGNKINGNQYFACIDWFILPLAEKCSHKRTDKVEVLIFLKKLAYIFANITVRNSEIVTCILFVLKIKGLRYPDLTGL